MRHVLQLLALFAFATVTPAADPRPAPTFQSHFTTYLGAMEKTADLLAKVTDEKSALDAKPKLDNLYDEGLESRRGFFAKLAESDLSDGAVADTLERLPKGLKQATDKIAAEFDRIASNQKAAYKVLRETKLFAGLEQEYEGKAARKAQNLLIYARTYSTRNDGKPPKLEDLATYAEEGKKALTDPWGFPYQMASMVTKEGVTRTYAWTVSPYTGKKLGSPPPEEKDEKK